MVDTVVVCPAMEMVPSHRGNGTRLRPSRRPWLVSPIALTRLSPLEQPPLFAGGRLAQLTPTSREAKRAAIARALELDLPAPLSQPD